MADNEEQEGPSDAQIAADARARLKEIRGILKRVVEGKVELAEVIEDYGPVFPEILHATNPPSEEVIKNMMSIRRPAETFKETAQPDVETDKEEPVATTIEEVQEQEAQAEKVEKAEAEEAEKAQAEAQEIDQAAEREAQKKKFNDREAMLKEAYKDVVAPLMGSYAAKLSSRVNKYSKMRNWFVKNAEFRKSDRDANPRVVLNLSSRERIQLRAVYGPQKFYVTRQVYKPSVGKGQQIEGPSRWHDMDMDDFGMEKYEDSKVNVDSTTMFISKDDLQDYLARALNKSVQESNSFSRVTWGLAKIAVPIGAIVWGANAAFDLDDKAKEALEKLNTWKNSQVEDVSHGGTFDEDESIVKTPDGQLFVINPEDDYMPEA